MALVLEGQLQEGIRELDTVQNYTEVGSLVDILFIQFRRLALKSPHLGPSGVGG